VNEESNFYLRFTDQQGVPLKVDPADLPMKTGGSTTETNLF
jgi:hypothetical protein